MLAFEPVHRARASRRRMLERARRRWVGPLFERLGYDLLPAVPEWRHRPLSQAEVERLLSGAAESLERDLAAAGVVSAEPPRLIVEDFWRLIPTCPVDQRHGGNGFNGALQIYAFARALRPATIVESGVFRGLTTWVLRQAAPEAAIYCFDPVLTRLHYRDPQAAYSTADWSRFDFRGVDFTKLLAFFDDHVSQARRILEARERGIRHLLFDDDVAAHRVHSHGGPAFPTVGMILDGVDQPVRWLRNGRELRYEPDPAFASSVRAAIATAHAFDDLHRVTGYSPTRLCYVALKPQDR